MLPFLLRTRVLAAGFVAFVSVIGLQSQTPSILPADPLVIAGTGPGGGQLTVRKADGTPVVTVAPFGPSFTGGVRAAAGDINGDGVIDIVVAMASNGGQVRALSGADGSSLGSITPFGPAFSGGVFVAMGDVNADGHDDVLLGAGSGGLAQLIDGATRTVLGTGRPFPLPYNAGVTVALGDLNGDGRADLVFGTTLGGFVRVLDFPSLTPIASGFPYGPFFSGGVNVAAGDVDGDGVDEVAVAPRNAGGPVRVYTASAELLIEGTPFGSVQGVNLAMGDLNGDGLDDLLMGAGAGAAPRVRAFSILDRTQLFDDLAFDAGFRSGVWVATPRSASTRFTSPATTTFTAGAPGTFAVTTQNGGDAVLSVGGTLPTGVAFTDHGDGTGALAGTPAAGTGGGYALTFVATRDGRQVAQQPFTLVVQEPAAITSGSAVTFASGRANTFTVTTSGAPVATTITATGVLPTGVTFTNHGSGTATLAGSPTPGSEGTYPLTLSASNGLGAPATQAFTLTVVADSTPLFTSADATTFTVGAVGNFSVLTSATPVAGTITVTGALPAGVTLTDHGNGIATLSGVPDAGTAGAYPLVFTADNGVASTPQNFTLTVDPVAGGAPTFTSGNAITLVVGAAGDFTATTIAAPVAATLTSSGALPAGITFVSNGDGTATLAGTAAAGTAGNYPLTFTADNGVATATQLFTLTVNNVSSSPVYTSGATTAFVIGASETFAVTTAAAPPVTGIAITGALPAGVTFTDNGDGTASLAGTPQAGTAGPYAVTFTATNGGTPVDQAFTLSVQETAAITSANARAFTVGIADSFTVTTAGLPVPTIALTTGALPAGVTYADNGDGTATIAGTAAAGTVGGYPLTFTATNGVGAPATQAFTLNVTQNMPPTLDVIPDPAAILEDAAQQMINLTGISAGAGDSQPLAVTAASSDPTVVPDPTVTYTSPNATGTLQYTPVPNASGSVVITVTVTDGGLDNDLGTVGDNGVVSRTFTVAVTSVNDPPTLDAIADPAAIDEDAAQQTLNLTGISTGGGETQVLQVTATSDTVGLIPNPTVTYTSPAAIGSLAYTPVAGESGTAIITVTVTDGGLDDDLGTPGDNLTATDTFTVTVNDVDDPPTLDAIADPAAISEDAPLQTINLSGISAGAGESATLVVTAVSNNPGLISNPTVTYTSPNATGSLSYTPVANTSGTAIITVTVSDGGATPTPRTFTIVVNDVNDAPTFTPGGNQTITEDAPAQTVNSFLGTVSAGPNEATQVVTVTINNVTNAALFSAGPAVSATGVLTYTPATEQFGTATISYTVSDNGGTANGGIDSVGPLTFDITVNAVNDPPTLDAIANPAAVLEDAAQQTINLSGIGTGSAAESAQPLQITAVSSNTALIPNPTVNYVPPNAIGSLDYTPVANSFGTAVITVTVTDGGLDNNLGTTGDNGTLVRTFTVNVTSVNDAPSFTKGADQTVLEDAGLQTVNPWATGISAGPSEGAQILAFEITGNTNPTLFSAGPSVSPSTGGLTYTPAANRNGAATITVRITDDGGTDNGGVDASATQTFVITVNAVNDAPVVTNKNFAAQANMAIVGLSGLLSGVTDADAGVNGCSPVFSVTNVSATNPAGGDITNLNTTAGTFDFNPPPGVVGPVTFTYTVTDTGCPGTATSAAATVTINVAGPVIWFVDDSAAGGGDGRLTSPFNALSGAAAVDAAGHVIFLYSGTYSSGITLNATESLIGQGAIAGSFDLLMGISPPAGTVPRPSIGGTRPSISVTSGTAVTLATGNVVHGLDVSNTNGSGIVGSAVGTLALANFDVSVTGGSALSLTTSGSVTATGTDNDLTSTTDTALNVNGVSIGAAGLAFKSISAGNTTAAADPVNGIVLSSTGATAGLTVTGSGSSTVGGDGSGGVIRNTTGRGILLANTKSPSFRNMQILNTVGSGVEGTLVDGFTFVNGTIDGSTDEGSILAEESNISFNISASLSVIAGTERSLSGVVNISNNVLTNALFHGIDIFNYSGTITDATISGNTITSSTDVAVSKGSAIRLIAFGSATTTAAVTTATLNGNAISNFPSGAGMVLQGGNANTSPSAPAGTFGVAFSATNIVNVTNNLIKGFSGGTPTSIPMNTNAIQTSVNGRGQGNFNISGNGTLANPITNVGGNVISTSALGLATVTETISNNVIVANHRPDFGGSLGISAGAGESFGIGTTGVLHITISGNTVSQTDSNAIRVNAAEGTSQVVAKILNNNVSAPQGSGVSPGIAVLSGNSSATNTQMSLEISGNTSAGENGQPGIGLRKQGTDPAVHVFGIEGLSPSPNTVGSQVTDHVNSLNPLSANGTILISAETGFTSVVVP